MSLVQYRRILTICSDFGSNDYRLSALKSAIYSHNNNIHILDINHEIELFNLVEASYHICNILKVSAPETIHLGWVFNCSEDEGILLAIYKDQYLILPNNGLLDLILKDDPAEKIYRISDDCVEYRDRIASALHLITSDQPLESVFSNLEDPVRKISVKPVYQKERIQARVIYIDHYGNIVFNISKSEFEKCCQDRKFSFVSQSQHVISNFTLSNQNRENGSFYVNFTPSENMTLCLCGRNASKTLDIYKEDTLQIIFQ